MSHIARVISSPLVQAVSRCRMNLRVRENPWRLMLAVNVAVVVGVFLYKITREPYVPYIHLLVDYHFGFTKRALIGAFVSLFFSKCRCGWGLRSAGPSGLSRSVSSSSCSGEPSASTTSLCRCSCSWRLAVLSEKLHAYAE